MLRPTDLGLPGPSAWDMARGFRAIRDDPIHFLVELAGRYGDIVALPVPGPPVLLLNDPEAVRHVLQTRARNWTKNTVQYAALATVTGPGLLAVADDRWLERRRTAQPAFHHGRLGSISAAVSGSARRLTRTWLDLPAEGRIVDAAELSMGLTLDVVGRTLFDDDLAEETRVLVEATDEAAEVVVAQGRSLPRPPWLPSRLTRRRVRAVAALDAVCARLIADRRRRGVGETDEDLLGLLIAAGLPDDAVRDELVTMVVAGHETVASALTWTLMLLAEHPDAQDRVRQEGRRDVDDGVVGLHGVRPWTRAVVDEAVRLYPPGWVVSRRSVQADAIAGLRLPPSTVAIISPWLLHRRPAAWPDQEAFRPQRFLDGGVTPNRADYLPFGLGPRLCIGRDFALVELTMLLGELLRDHEVSLPVGFRRPALDAFVTVRPRGGMPLLVRAVS